MKNNQSLKHAKSVKSTFLAITAKFARFMTTTLRERKSSTVRNVEYVESVVKSKLFIAIFVNAACPLPSRTIINANLSVSKRTVLSA